MNWRKDNMNKRIKKKLRKRFRLRTYSKYKKFKTNMNKLLTIAGNLIFFSSDFDSLKLYG